MSSVTQSTVENGRTQIAVRLHGPADLRVETLPYPGAPARGEVLLRVLATGVCGSDLHPYETGSIGSTNLESPLVLGHEFAGVVEQIGEGVDTELVGARVAVDPSQPCNECFHCTRGNQNLCRNQKFAGLWPDDGSLCQWMRVPARNCYVVPDSVSNAEAAMLEPLGIALHATDLARIRVGSSVAIIGAGPIGLCLIQTARLAGASNIYIIEQREWRREQAEKLGAKALPAGVETDVTIEAAWANESIQQAMETTRGGGTVVLVGIPLEDEVTFKHSVARRKGLTILMSRRMNHVFPRALQLVESGRIDLKSLITHRYRLEEVPEAFRMNAAYEDNVIKTIIEHRKTA
ncbi:MAG TPA: alcohol dehydrogenase catalytic domain-containing protein [Abditibacteriaceae bacterium]|jgi:L-iditol 2-dehydrogenase